MSIPVQINWIHTRAQLATLQLIIWDQALVILLGPRCWPRHARLSRKSQSSRRRFPRCSQVFRMPQASALPAGHLHTGLGLAAHRLPEHRGLRCPSGAVHQPRGQGSLHAPHPRLGRGQRRRPDLLLPRLGAHQPDQLQVQRAHRPGAPRRCACCDGSGCWSGAGLLVWLGDAELHCLQLYIWSLLGSRQGAVRCMLHCVLGWGYYSQAS